MPVIAKTIPPKKGDGQTSIVKPAGMQNHRSEEAGRAMFVLSSKVKATASELLDLGRRVDHPIFKICARILEKVTETPITECIVDMYSEQKSRNAVIKVKGALFPPNLANMKNTIKNKLKNIVYEWEASYRKIFNDNQFLKSRVGLLRSVIDFIEKYNNTGDAGPVFTLINKYNVALSS